VRRRIPLRYVAAGLLLVSAVTTQNETLYAARGAGPAARATRRVKKYDSLTGLWAGAYTMPFGPSVPFNAQIEDIGGSLSGRIDEPNTFGAPSAPLLYASLRGARDGVHVTFIKRYDGTAGVSHTVGYEGDVNANFTRIEGEWSLPQLSGAFFMERAEAGAEAAEERAVSAGA
jgi:hypothetical protein